MEMRNGRHENGNKMKTQGDRFDLNTNTGRGSHYISINY